MGSPLSIVFIVALLIPLWVLLRRDYIKGVAYAVFLCVSMSTYLRIPMPGSLPQLTIYRLVLIVVFIFWLRNRDTGRRFSNTPLLGAFAFWAIANFISVLFTTSYFVVSLKRYLDFVLEAAVFFFLVVNSLRRREDVFKVLWGACLGVTLVAGIAFIEKYTGYTPVSYIEPQNPDDSDLVGGYMRGDVVATYQHRILLGTGMAMGFPLVFALMLVAQKLLARTRSLWFFLALVLASCYFSNSRGPWLAALLAGGTLWFLGRVAIRKKLACIAVVAALVLIMRPGVLTSLVASAQVTTESDSFKGGTFRYRLELWRIAWSEISKSPERLLFGCGPGCGSTSTVDWNLSYRGGLEWQIWSWDNQLAYDLYQSGLLGLAASLTLYGGLLLAVYRLWRHSEPADKPLLACFLASLLAYAFMLTNVMMFAKPANFLFWTIAAAAFAIGLNPQPQEYEAVEEAAGVEVVNDALEPELSKPSP
jgi:O-antigen ligase